MLPSRMVINGHRLPDHRLLTHIGYCTCYRTTPMNTKGYRQNTGLVTLVTLFCTRQRESYIHTYTRGHNTHVYMMSYR
jgi:hypothetical protein